MEKDIDIIGRAEKVQLVDLSEQLIPAKVDTGADLSSIWASEISEADGVLSFVLFDKSSPYYTGKANHVSSSDYKLTRVASSFGTKELRYVVKLRIRIRGRLVKTTFTLADRKFKTYPILLGRRLLHRKFLVDVSRGEPLRSEERKKKQRLQQELENNSTTE